MSLNLYFLASTSTFIILMLIFVIAPDLSSNFIDYIFFFDFHLLCQVILDAGLVGMKMKLGRYKTSIY
jgi:hypothetical protein